MTDRTTSQTNELFFGRGNNNLYVDGKNLLMTGDFKNALMLLSNKSFIKRKGGSFKYHGHPEISRAPFPSITFWVTTARLVRPLAIELFVRNRSDFNQEKSRAV